MKKNLALIPARAGSKRVPGKNIRSLGVHPLIAYTIAVARASGIYDKVIVSTDSEEIRRIAQYYGAEAPFLRPEALATSVSPDIEWIKHAFSQLPDKFEAFSVLRPTSPFRTTAMIKRAFEQFKSLPEIDSLRAVELCKQHPGKMWVVEGKIMRPLLDQSHLEVAWHAGQYQALPKVYVQNSALEMAWVRVVAETNSREGKVIAPFFTDNIEGFAIDYEGDWERAENMAAKGKAMLPEIDFAPYR